MSRKHRKNRKNKKYIENKYDCIHGNFILYCSDCMSRYIFQQSIELKKKNATYNSIY